MFPSPRILSGLLALAIAAPSLSAQDAPPVDLNEVLQALKAMREKQELQSKSTLQRALREAQTGAASGQAAAAAWEEAVRQVQFQGAPREGAQFREWKEREGSAFRSKEVQNAARLHFAWLGLTIQRALGLSNKELLPLVVAYTKELSAHQLSVEEFNQSIQHEKELAEKNKTRAERAQTGEAAKKVLDQIHGMSVDGKGGDASPVAKSLNLGDSLAADKWEPKPNSYAGIFEKIILPELRAAKDPRLLEYWERELKREADAASTSKLAFEIDKFNQQRKPEILWSRAQDMLLIGQKNRAVGEMFSLIKTYPAHPRAGEWIGKLEAVLRTAPEAPSAGAPAPAT